LFINPILYIDKIYNKLSIVNYIFTTEEARESRKDRKEKSEKEEKRKNNHKGHKGHRDDLLIFFSLCSF